MAALGPVRVPCPLEGCSGHIDVALKSWLGERHPATNTIDLHVEVDQERLTAAIDEHLLRSCMAVTRA